MRSSLEMRFSAHVLGQCCLLLVGGGLILCGPGPAIAEDRNVVPGEADIPSLIEQLSDPEFAVRTRATRALCAVGERAIVRLRDAAGGSDREAALRARKIIEALERILFAGVEIRLETDRTTLGWDEAIDVRVVL